MKFTPCINPKATPLQFKDLPRGAFFFIGENGTRLNIKITHTGELAHMGEVKFNSYSPALDMPTLHDNDTWVYQCSSAGNLQLKHTTVPINTLEVGDLFAFPRPSNIALYDDVYQVVSSSACLALIIGACPMPKHLYLRLDDGKLAITSLDLSVERNAPVVKMEIV